MTNKLDQVYNKLRGRKLCELEAQCFDGVMIEEVIRHRLGVPEHEHPYFDDVDMLSGRRNDTWGSVGRILYHR
jgi:hypothetical protein